MITNCPNCGAPIVGTRCEYCDTPFIDLTCIRLDRPAPIKMRYGSNIIQMVAYPERVSMQYGMDDFSCYRDMYGGLEHRAGALQPRITLELVACGEVTTIYDPELLEGSMNECET